jgi:hypothetical protein
VMVLPAWPSQQVVEALLMAVEEPMLMEMNMHSLQQPESYTYHLGSTDSSSPSTKRRGGAKRNDRYFLGCVCRDVQKRALLFGRDGAYNSPYVQRRQRWQTP